MSQLTRYATTALSQVKPTLTTHIRISVCLQKELLSPPRAIQTPEELSLLVKIYEAQNRHDELLDILNSENLGISSRIAQNDWSFVRTKMLILEKLDQWEEALKLARELLALPDGSSDDAKAAASVEERDDWKVWSLLLAATENLGKTE